MGTEGIQMRLRKLSTKARPLVVLAGLLALVSVSYAHDSHRPELNNWFSGLKSEGGGLCCSGSDATVIRDADWDTKDGHYRVRIEGQWVDVPDDAVVKGPNLDGQTLAWPIYYRSLGEPARIGIRCFMPGTQG